LLLTALSTQLTPHSSHSSHLTPHIAYTPHLTPHTPHLTPHTSHLTPHTSHLTPHTSHLTPHTSHLTPLTSQVIPHAFHCSPNSYVLISLLNPRYMRHMLQVHRLFHDVAAIVLHRRQTLSSSPSSDASNFGPLSSTLPLLDSASSRQHVPSLHPTVTVDNVVSVQSASSHYGKKGAGSNASLV
jgi:hypothetical protein